MTTTFENAQVGDKVYSLRYGEGKIFSSIDIDAYLPLRIKFELYTGIFSYHLDGRCTEKDITRDLYWSKPEIIAPEQPKRGTKTIKTIEGFIVTDPHRFLREKHCVNIGPLYFSKEEAQNSFSTLRSSVKDKCRVIKITTEEFEVEE